MNPAPASANDPRVLHALEEYIAEGEAAPLTFPSPLGGEGRVRGTGPQQGMDPGGIGIKIGGIGVSPVRSRRDHFLARYPDIAGVLAECLDALDFVRSAAPQLESPDILAPGFEPVAPLGDFRIVREIGRGGMGVVYEAEQLSLGRRVALKVLPFAAAIDSKQLQRFKNEAHAAAGLQHTNIVPVYFVGCERGVHFYAMQFVEGQTLAALIHDLRQLEGREDRGTRMEDRGSKSALGAGLPTPPKGPTAGLPEPTGPYTREEDKGARSGDQERDQKEDNTTIEDQAAGAETLPAQPRSSILDSPSSFFRTVANLGIQAAEALEHAHQLGVIHRDIKPANMMVDARGNLWITDFGLAHCQGAVELTMSGDLLGTLRYMSPEQALAQRVLVDQRTDIYSLGATLYELLTLEPAFPGTDRRQLLRQIAFEEPKPPRRLNKAIPAELETIVLKAVEKNPADRYGTAQELADDLERYLKDEAIRARRPSPRQRAAKWIRRHPGVTGTAGVSALVTLLLAVAGLWANNWMMQAEQKQTKQERDRAFKAEEEGKSRLFHSLVAQARGKRLSRRVGQRFECLGALEEATQLARQLNLPEADFLELRNEVISCLALLDLRVAKEWEGWPSGTVNVDFDATLERYARSDRAGHVSVRRVADDTLICQLPDLPPGVLGVRFSDDGQFLGVRPNGNNWLKVWNLSAPRSPPLLDVPAFHDFCFSPDSRRVAVAHGDGSINVSELPSGQRLRRFPPGPPLAWIAFRPNTQQLAVSHSGGIQIHDLDTGNIVADLPQPGFSGLAWHAEGKMLAASVAPENRVYLWDVPARKQTVILQGHNASGIICAFPHAGDLLATTCWDGKLRLWDSRTGKQLFSTPWEWSPWLRFSPDDRLLAGQVDGSKLRIWEVASGGKYRTLVRDPVLGRISLGSAAVHGDGRLLALGMQDGFGLFDLESGRALDFIKLPGLIHVLFEPGGLLTQISGCLMRWPIQPDPASPALLRVGPPEKLSLPWSVSAASGDGRVMAVPQNWGALVVHRDRPDQPIRLERHDDVRNVAVSPDRRWVATGSFGASPQAKVWDALTGKLEKELPTGPGQHVAFSADGRWLATSGDSVRAWEVSSWRLGADKKAVIRTFLAFSPDSRLLAYDTGHGAVCLVDPQTGREYARLEDPNQDRANWICFSPDGTRLVTVSGDSQSVHVWDLRAIRDQLAEMDLDWDLPPYPPAGDPKDAPPLRVTVDLGDLDPAKVRAFEEARDANNTAWPLATNPDAKQRDPARAIELAHKGVGLAPKQAIYWNTLGVAHYRAGHWKDAIEALTKSMELQKGALESFDTFFLAMAHWQLGKKEEARKWYNQAVGWMENNKANDDELRRFRAEAADLLGIKDENTDHKGTKNTKKKP